MFVLINFNRPKYRCGALTTKLFKLLLFEFLKNLNKVLLQKLLQLQHCYPHILIQRGFQLQQHPVFICYF